MHLAPLARLGLPLLCLGLSACAGAGPPSLRASLNCENISDPKSGGMTYLECVQQWMRTNEPAPVLAR